MKIKFIIILFCSLLSLCMTCQPSTANITKDKINHLGLELVNVVGINKNKIGICFIDLKTGLKLSINGKRKFPAASVIKVPIMATAYNLAENGRIELEQKIQFKKEDILGGSGVLQWMKPGNLYTLRNLVRLMIVLSDNTATKMVVDRIGTNEVNSFLESHGLDSTYMIDDTCLNEHPSRRINYSTPDDMAKLFSIIQNSSHFSNKSIKEMIGYLKFQRYRWGIWRGLPKGVIVANKTGNVEGVLNDTGIVYAPQGSYILSIFTYGFTKKSEARKAINKISEMVFKSTK